MAELNELVGAYRAARASGAELALATVVEVTGSAYRKPGARMLFSRERWLAGSVSGGCLERDLVRRGFFACRDGAALLRFDGAADERQGSGCDGLVEVLVQRLAPERLDVLQVAERCLEGERPVRVSTVVRATSYARPGTTQIELLGDGAPSPGTPRLESRAGGSVFVEELSPAPRLFVFGSAHDAPPLIALAQGAGFTVSACPPDTRAETLARLAGADAVLGDDLAVQVRAVERSPCALAVIMGHHYERDLEALCALLPTSVRYVGLLGSRERARRIVADAEARCPGRVDARVHAPVGLELGAEGPREIALSIVAEALAVLRGKAGLKRRDVAPAP